jgi:hypothetical protein
LKSIASPASKRWVAIVAQEMNMAVGRREIDDGNVAAEESVDLDLSPTLVSADAAIIGSCLKKSLASGSYVSQGTSRRRTSP